MGALGGSLTYSRFFITGDVPDDLSASAMKRIRANAFLPLVADDEEAQRHGWCSLSDSMDTDLDHEKVFWNEFVCLGLRVDTWVVPKPLLLAHLRTAEEAILEKKGIEKLGRQAKTELKAMVVRKLRKQLVPVTRAVDLVWNVNTGVARFFSQSPKVHLLAQELFEKTFRLSMVPESPGTAAERRGMDARAQKIWDQLVPTQLGQPASAEIEVAS